MKPSIIDIGSAPAELRPYLALADKKGNSNGVVEDRQEAWVAAREYCRSNPNNCNDATGYMADHGHYFPQIPPYLDKPPPVPPRVPPLPANYSGAFSLMRYRGGKKKPAAEINWGIGMGNGYYKFEPHSGGEFTVFNPAIGLDLNFNERIRGSCEVNYAVTDEDQGFSVQSLGQRLGAAYDVSPHRPDETRRSRTELHVGGGLSLKNAFIMRGNEMADSVNYGGYVLIEAGTVTLWGIFSPRPIPEGWTKFFIIIEATEGEKAADLSVVLGGKYCFERYEKPATEKGK